MGAALSACRVFFRLQPRCTSWISSCHRSRASAGKPDHLRRRATNSGTPPPVPQKNFDERTFPPWAPRPGRFASRRAGSPFRAEARLWNSAFLSPKRPLEELRLLLLLRAKGKEKRNNKCQDACASRRSYKSTKEAVLGDAKEHCRNHASDQSCYHKHNEHLPASRSVTRVSSTKQGPLGSTWGQAALFPSPTREDLLRAGRITEPVGTSRYL